MEIGMITAGSASSTKNTISASKNNKGFGAVFAGVLAPKAGMQGDTTVNSKTETLSAETLESLKKLLETEHVLDIENGFELLGKAVLQNEQTAIELIAEKMDMTLEDLEALLTNVFAALQPEAELNLQDINAEIQQRLQQLIDAVSQLEPAQLPAEISEKMAIGIQALKLYELLAAHQDSPDRHHQLKDLLKGFQEVVQAMIDHKAQGVNGERQVTVPKSVQMNSMLHSLFAAAAEEVNATAGANEKVIPKHEVLSNGFVQFQQMSKPEQLTLMLNNQSGRPVSAEQLMQQFENILAKSHLFKNGGTQKLLIKLNPEHLGSLRIELIQRDASLTARILTTTATAKELLDSQLNGLKQAFAAQNLQVEKLEINQQFSQQERFLNKEQQQSSGNGQRQNQQSEDGSKEHQDDFLKSFEEAMLNTEV